MSEAPTPLSRLGLAEGILEHLGSEAVLFTLDPTLQRMLAPLCEEVGTELFRLLVSYHGAEGMAKNGWVGSNEDFAARFRTWAASLEQSGAGTVELIEFDASTRSATVRACDPWELRLQRDRDEDRRWGCPVLFGQLVGIFRRELEEPCWADEELLSVGPDGRATVEFRVRPCKNTFPAEIERLRQERLRGRERQLDDEVVRRGKRLELTQAAIDRCEASVFWIAPDGHFTFVNDSACRGLGFTRDELLRLGVSDVDPEHDPDRWRRHWAELKRAGSIELETTHRRRDGTEFPVHVSANYVEFDGAEHNFAYVTDLTERRREESEVRAIETKLQQVQAIESLGVMAGGIAHDFNNLLTGILGSADLLTRKLPGDSALLSDVKRIKRSAHAAAELCGRMLDSAGRRTPVVEVVRLSNFLVDAKPLLDLAALHKDSVDLDLAPDTPEIDADPTQLRQVVMNLVTNASEAYGERSGRIVVRAGRDRLAARDLAKDYIGNELEDGTYAFVEVVDEGEGLAEEQAVRVFDPFFTTKFTGRGLGLAAVLGIVRNHGGAIRFESRLGRGTRVRALFPLHGTKQDEQASQRRSESDDQAPTVLVVDDEEFVRSFARSCLEHLGYRVHVADGGRLALELLERANPAYDAVLLDLTMPGVGGSEVLTEIRRKLPELPVVLSTGFGPESLESIDPRPDGFLRKPYDLDALEAVLDSVLVRRSSP